MLKSVLLLGGSGFVGTAVVNRLTQSGVQVVIPARRRERSKDLISLPNVSVVEMHSWNKEDLLPLVQGRDAVINLAGILHSKDVVLPYAKDFADVHVALPQQLIAACEQAGVRRFIHMSALNASTDAPSEYLRSKGQGEAVVRASTFCQSTIFQPSVIFGQGDRFINFFAKLLSWRLPLLPLAGAHARFQPVWVGDVADAIVAALHQPETSGKTYELCGPKVYSMREIILYIAHLLGVSVRIVPLPEALSYVQAGLLWLFPRPLMSPDNLRSMQIDSVSASSAHRFPGWQPHSLESVVPTYVGHTVRARLNEFRDFANRTAS